MGKDRVKKLFSIFLFFIIFINIKMSLEIILIKKI